MPDNLPEEAVELINGMKLCSTFMATIMNNLLDVRKIEEGKMELKCNPLSVSELLHNVRKMLLPVVRPGVELLVICETTNTMPPTSVGGSGRRRSDCACDDLVIGDEHRLKQILYNICRYVT
jgi:signal transduction histidine kinase